MGKKHPNGKCDCWITEPVPDHKDKKIAELEAQLDAVRTRINDIPDFGNGYWKAELQALVNGEDDAAHN